MDTLLIYLILINVITFLSFFIDKKRAIKDQWRIPESRLLFLSLIGGSLGGLIGMALVRHKTKKLKFTIGMPLLLLLNIYIIYVIKIKIM